MPKISNPFADVESKAAPAEGAWSGESGTEASAYAPPPATNKPATNGADLAKKEAELAARQAEIERREAALKGQAIPLKKNWPACFPLTRHDIGSDIPSDLRAMVRLLYTCYLALCVCLLYNLFAASVMLGLKVDNKISSWFLAVIYMVTGIPLAFIFWYKRLYNAAATDRALSYMAFFILFGLHTAFCIWAAIAVPFSKNSWSFAGFATAIKAFDTKAYTGIIYIVGSCLWTLESLLSLWCFKVVYSTFRGQKTDTKLKGEVATAVIQAHAAAGPARV